MMSVTYYAIIIFSGVATLGPTGPLALPSSRASTHNSCTIAIVVLTYFSYLYSVIVHWSIKHIRALIKLSILSSTKRRNIANISTTKNIFNIDR